MLNTQLNPKIVSNQHCYSQVDIELESTLNKTWWLLSDDLNQELISKVNELEWFMDDLKLIVDKKREKNMI
jgi:hypothetical protein